ncbi:MAG: hypothetical protein R3Y18_00820, partial [Bacillota bacterium]
MENVKNILFDMKISEKSEEILQNRLSQIPPSNVHAVQKTQKRFDTIAKPLKGLGVFEEIVSRLAGVCEN